jgi:hypothetical protein
MKEQLAASLRERQIAETRRARDKIHAREIFGKPALVSAARFGFEPVDEGRP